MSEHSGDPIEDRPDLTHVDGYPTFEVFRQRRTGEAFAHVGQVEAPDADTALLVAKEHYSRRETCSALWVVDRRHVHEAAWDADVLSAGREKNYRRVLGRRASLDVLA